MRAMISAIASLVVPGAGHAFVNFQFLRGLLIFIIFISFGTFILMLNIVGAGIIFYPFFLAIPILSAVLAYRDSKKNRIE